MSVDKAVNYGLMPDFNVVLQIFNEARNLIKSK